MLVVKCKKVTQFSYPGAWKKFTPPRPEDLWVAELKENDIETANKLEEAGLNVMSSKMFYHEPYRFFRFRAYDEMNPIGEFYVHNKLIDSCLEEDSIRDFLNKHYKDLVLDHHADIELHLDIDEPRYPDRYSHAVLRKIVVNVEGVALSSRDEYHESLSKLLEFNELSDI